MRTAEEAVLIAALEEDTTEVEARLRNFNLSEIRALEAALAMIERTISRLEDEADRMKHEHQETREKKK